MRKVVNRWLRSLSGWRDMVLASQCPLCQRSTSRELCQDCWTQVRRCQWVGCQTWHEPLPVFAWGQYKGALKRTIATLKYDNHRQLARPLGHWLAEAWITEPTTHPRTLTVVPIPLHPSKQQERGFNQAELLGRSFCEITRLPLQPHGLIRSRSTEAQFHLSPQAREQNLSGAFELGTLRHHRPRHHAVLLIDDIYTTGSTARSAVRVLQQFHIPVYGIVAVARASNFKQFLD